MLCESNRGTAVRKREVGARQDDLRRRRLIVTSPEIDRYVTTVDCMKHYLADPAFVAVFLAGVVATWLSIQVIVYVYVTCSRRAKQA